VRKVLGLKITGTAGNDTVAKITELPRNEAVLVGLGSELPHKEQSNMVSCSNRTLVQKQMGFLVID
jgi:hypothetical protein